MKLRYHNGRDVSRRPAHSLRGIRYLFLDRVPSGRGGVCRHDLAQEFRNVELTIIGGIPCGHRAGLRCAGFLFLGK